MTLTLLMLLTFGQPAAPTLDALLEKLVEQRAALEAARKAEAATVLEIQKRYKELTDKLASLGITPGPGPKPVPPDALRTKIVAAWEADAAPIAEKREQARDLAALFREAAKLAHKSDIVTSEQLAEKVRQASANLIGPKALVEVKRAVSGELGLILGVDDTLTDAQRTAAATLFTRLAEILDGV